MSDFYQEMRDMATDLLSETSKGGLGQQGIRLVKRVEIPPANSWEMPTYSNRSYDLKAVAKGVSEEFIGLSGSNGTVIVASDKEVVMDVSVQKVSTGDTISIDGKAGVVLLVIELPAAGIKVARKAVVGT